MRVDDRVRVDLFTAPVEHQEARADVDQGGEVRHVVLAPIGMLLGLQEPLWVVWGGLVVETQDVSVGLTL